MARSLMRKDDLVAVATAYNEGKSEGDANSAYHKVRTVLLERHPKAAATRALLRASTLFERGERDAADIWFQIGAMIRRMEAEKSTPGETVQ